MDCWLTIARQEKIASLKGINRYNPNLITMENCIGKSLGTVYSTELGIARIISIWILQIIDLFVASDSEPDINVSGEAGQ